MAILFDLNERDPMWSEWVAERPPRIRKLIEQYPPNRLYRMGDGHRVTIESYREDGTVSVAVTGEFNLVTFERHVFGVDPANLVECDLPGPDELLGALLRDRDQVDAYIASIRRDPKETLH